MDIYCCTLILTPGYLLITSTFKPTTRNVIKTDFSLVVKQINHKPGRYVRMHSAVILTPTDEHSPLDRATLLMTGACSYQRMSTYTLKGLHSLPDMRMPLK